MTYSVFWVTQNLRVGKWRGGHCGMWDLRLDMFQSLAGGTVSRVSSHLGKKFSRWCPSQHSDREPVNRSNPKIQVGRQTGDNTIRKMSKFCRTNKDSDAEMGKGWLATGIRSHRVTMKSPTISLNTETMQLPNQGSLSFPFVGTGFVFSHSAH